MKRIFQCFGCKGSPCTLTLNNVYASTRVPKKCMYELAVVNWKEKTSNNEAIKAKREKQKEATGVLEKLLEEHRRSALSREGVDCSKAADKIPAEHLAYLKKLESIPPIVGSADGRVFRYCAFGNPDSLSQ